MNNLNVSNAKNANEPVIASTVIIAETVFVLLSPNLILCIMYPINKWRVLHAYIMFPNLHEVTLTMEKIPIQRNIIVPSQNP